MIRIIRRWGLGLAIAAAMVPAIPVVLTLCRLPGGHLPVRLLAGDCGTTRCHGDACCREEAPPAPVKPVEAAPPVDSCGCCMALALGGAPTAPVGRPVPVVSPDAVPCTAAVVLRDTPASTVGAFTPDAAPPPPDIPHLPLRI